MYLITCCVLVQGIQFSISHLALTKSSYILYVQEHAIMIRSEFQTQLQLSEGLVDSGVYAGHPTISTA